jgi:hypothetical protein
MPPQQMVWQGFGPSHFLIPVDQIPWFRAVRFWPLADIILPHHRPRHCPPFRHPIRFRLKNRWYLPCIQSARTVAEAPNHEHFEKPPTDGASHKTAIDRSRSSQRANRRSLGGIRFGCPHWRRQLQHGGGLTLAQLRDQDGFPIRKFQCVMVHGRPV